MLEEKHLFGDVFLDVPIVVELLKINETITIIIDTEIYFDGLSLWKLDIKGIRNPIKKENYKASSKSDGNIQQNYWKDVMDFSLSIFWFSFVSNFLSFLSTYLNNKIDWKNSYSWKLFVKEKQIWNTKFSAIKNNGSKWNLPSIMTKTKIVLAKKTDWILTCRLNIPISWLSRDHARWIKITTKNKVIVLVDDYEVLNSELLDSITTWSITYKTLSST